MNLRPKRTEEPEINLTSLIDLALLLLIFFMVTTTFKDDLQISINLPKASEKVAKPEQQSIKVMIDAEGQYYVNDEKLVNIQIETLKRALQQSAAGQSSPLIIVKADGKTPHQSVITAMDAARQLGYHRLGFATSRSDDKSQ